MQPGMRGCTHAFIVTPRDTTSAMREDATLTMNMIQCAMSVETMRHIVLASSWTVGCAKEIPEIASRFVRAEELLQSSKVGWTILRGGFFHSNYTNCFRGGDGAVSFVDFCVPSMDPSDIGRVAAHVVHDCKRHDGRIYDISGTKRNSMSDVARVFSEVLGNNFQFAAADNARCFTRLPTYLAEVYEYAVNEGEDAVPMTDHVFKITGTPPMSLATWIRRNRLLF